VVVSDPRTAPTAGHGEPDKQHNHRDDREHDQDFHDAHVHEVPTRVSQLVTLISPRCAMVSRLSERVWSKSNSSRLLRAGKRTARMRPSPPARMRAFAAVGLAGGDLTLQAGDQELLV
jgi:hypothetical protein